jgi:hypothetical protein
MLSLYLNYRVEGHKEAIFHKFTYITQNDKNAGCGEGMRDLCDNS